MGGCGARGMGFQKPGHENRRQATSPRQKAGFRGKRAVGQGSREDVRKPAEREDGGGNG